MLRIAARIFILHVVCYDQNGAMLTAVPAAIIAPWTLPRAKNCSPALNFCTSLRTGAALSSPSVYKKFQTPEWVSGIFGTPKGTRTPDLLVRSQSLYPTELSAHTHFSQVPTYSSIPKTKMQALFSKIAIIFPYSHTLTRIWRLLYNK